MRDNHLFWAEVQTSAPPQTHSAFGFVFSMFLSFFLSPSFAHKQDVEAALQSEDLCVSSTNCVGSGVKKQKILAKHGVVAGEFPQGNSCAVFSMMLAS